MGFSRSAPGSDFRSPTRGSSFSRRIVPEPLRGLRFCVVGGQSPAVVRVNHAKQVLHRHLRPQPWRRAGAHPFCEFVDDVAALLEQKGRDKLLPLHRECPFRVAGHCVPGKGALKAVGAPGMQFAEFIAQGADPTHLRAVCHGPFVDKRSGALQKGLETGDLQRAGGGERAHPRQRRFPREDPVVDQYRVSDEKGRHAEPGGVADAEVSGVACVQTHGNVCPLCSGPRGRPDRGSANGSGRPSAVLPGTARASPACPRSSPGPRIRTCRFHRRRSFASSSRLPQAGRLPAAFRWKERRRCGRTGGRSCLPLPASARWIGTGQILAGAYKTATARYRCRPVRRRTARTWRPRLPRLPCPSSVPGRSLACMRPASRFVPGRGLHIPRHRVPLHRGRNAAVPVPSAPAACGG